MTLCTDAFLPLARATARHLGLPDLPIVTLPHPVGDMSDEVLADYLKAAADDLVEAVLTKPEAPTAAIDEAVGTTRVPADPFALFSASMTMGFGDGLPVLPPTAERVKAMLDAVPVPRGTVLGLVPPIDAPASLSTVAANAVLAGCDPALFAYVIAALEAVLEPEFNLRGTQTTTHPVAPLVVVHGPSAEALGFNAKGNTFGQGNQANATVGRALRLILQNIGGAVPRETDQATHGSPAKYTYCIAENRDATPWQPFAVGRDVGGDVDAVTVVGAEAPHNINDHGSDKPEGLLTTIAGTMATVGVNNLYLRGDVLLVLGPEHAALLARHGLTREDVQRELAARASVPTAQISARNLSRFGQFEPDLFDPPPPDGAIPLLDAPEELLVICAGGPGKHSMFVPTFGSTRSVTRPVTIAR